jgi:mannose-1-phosphate guanylyltransferase
MPEKTETPKALILVGGLGTRLRPLTEDTPKALMPLLNRPFMEHVIAHLRWYGVKEIVLALHYLPEAIKEALGDGSDLGVRLTYSLETEPLGTAGAVKNAAGHLRDGAFFVLNGDVFTDLDLDAMLDYHYEREAAATIAMHRVADPSAYGVIETGNDGRVRRFVEKPPREEAASNWINAGTYILEPEVLEMIPAGHYMFEHGLFPALLAAGKPVFGYQVEGYWTDMGRPEHYLALSEDLLLGRTDSHLLELPADGLARPAGGINAAAVLQPPVFIGEGCRIAPGAAVNGPVVMGENCRLAEDTVVSGAVLWDNVSIGAGARLSNCIVGRGVSVAPGTSYDDTVITATESTPISK